MAEHYGEYAADIERFNQETAMAIQAQERNPMNKDLDINNPSSAAALQLQSLQQLIQEKAHISESLEKMKAEDMKKFDAGEITAEDLAERNRYYTAPLKDHMSGKLIPPPALGFYEYQKEYNDIIGGLQLDKTAYAGPGETGYIFSGTNEFIKPERIEQAARNMAANPASKQYEFKRRQLAKMQTVDPQGYDRIVAEAAKNRMSPEQYSTWEDLKSMASTRQTRTAGSDQTFNNKMGSGWGKDEEGVDRFLRKGASIAKGDPETMKPFDRRTANVPDFVLRALPEDGEVTFTNEYNGVMLTPLADKTPVVINGVYRHGNMIYIDRRIAGQEGKLRSSYPGKDPETGKVKTADSLPVLQMTNEEFLTGIVEEVAGGNKDLNREIIYRRAKDLGMLNEQGTIDPWKGQQKPGAADLILAPTSKKGMMN